MNMRIGFSIVYAILIAVLLFCAVKSFRSNKSIGRSVGLLNLSLIPPLIGNLVIIVSSIRELSFVGCYIYFLGMDLVMLALVRFTVEYCSVIVMGKLKRTVMYAAIALDAVQLILNLFFAHAFDLEVIQVQGAPYYRLVPLCGLYDIFQCYCYLFCCRCAYSKDIQRTLFRSSCNDASYQCMADFLYRITYTC